MLISFNTHESIFQVCKFNVKYLSSKVCSRKAMREKESTIDKVALRTLFVCCFHFCDLNSIKIDVIVNIHFERFVQACTKYLTRSLFSANQNTMLITHDRILVEKFVFLHFVNEMLLRTRCLIKTNHDDHAFILKH